MIAIHILKVGDEQISDHTYFVFRVDGIDNPILKTVMSSRETWAKVIRTLIHGDLVSAAARADQLVAVAMTLQSQIRQLPDLLSGIEQVSDFDISSIQVYAATLVRDSMQLRCDVLKMAKKNCPLGPFETIRTNVINHVREHYNLDDHTLTRLKMLVSNERATFFASASLAPPPDPYFTEGKPFPWGNLAGQDIGPYRFNTEFQNQKKSYLIP
jgi:hypothetical protein